MDCLLEVLYLRMLQDPAWRRPFMALGVTQRQVAQEQVAALMTDLHQLIHDTNIGGIVPTHLSEPEQPH
ncbi:MAG: hypothetical protein GXP21_00015 [Gammaproteobacteria bacterium]|nr:hypothetical protein [Gammaproteobacteria bacterium]